MSALKLHRVRAGRYESTKGEPVEGTIAISLVDDIDGWRPYWNVAQYVAADWCENHVELTSLGEAYDTLAAARAFVAKSIESGLLEVAR